eukprot:m.159278 g.159278  ORF g.159278 m.159278 type:complete len:87 (+) comp14340_c0_seq44:2864-3124(+)
MFLDAYEIIQEMQDAEDDDEENALREKAMGVLGSEHEVGNPLKMKMLGHLCLTWRVPNLFCRNHSCMVWHPFLNLSFTEPLYSSSM